MAEHPYSVGDRVLVSRDLSGEEHVEGLVVDAFTVLTAEQSVMQVIVEFGPGDRQFVVIDDNVIQPAPADPAPAPAEIEPAPAPAAPPVPPPPAT
ncbi:MAG: hypothetical protein F2663_04375 [Actinobacteria bacterium]|uniref:Unannotated protein n=1 Tax=freshwater metagenome TaxID=449393 RepID=A0A6J6PAK4_9ZZZZ|nr:hypothetical protein [Actinomycetota bacterium]